MTRGPSPYVRLGPMAVVRDLRVLLRFQGFRRLLAVRLLSQGADGVYQVALAAYVVFSPEKQTSAAAIASAMAVLLLPDRKSTRLNSSHVNISNAVFCLKK